MMKLHYSTKLEKFTFVGNGALYGRLVDISLGRSYTLKDSMSAICIASKLDTDWAYIPKLR